MNLRREVGASMRRAGLEDGQTVVVAVSGGLDSVVLLHVFCFSRTAPSLNVVAAHYDHGMRAGSQEDLDWTRGLARSWGCGFREDRAPAPVTSEEEARGARYGFLERVRAVRAASLVVTAHHADDQAETVLFRIVRGTGLRGLRGIPERRPPHIWRPLLPFERSSLEAYAAENGLSWREDPTNRDLRFARNALRSRILPEIEGLVARGARAALVRLARRAAEEEAAWESIVPGLLTTLGVETASASVTLSRDRLLDLDPAVQARVLRSVAEELGGALDTAGTRAAVEFTSSGASGRRLCLTGGLVMSRSFDRIALARGRLSGPDRLVRIDGAGKGWGEGRIGGRSLRVTWGRDERSAEADASAFALVDVEFPLEVRAWMPGDRVQLSYGTKKLKKLFAEQGVPVPDRHRTPVLADAAGRVLWVPGVVRSTVAPAAPGDEALHIGIAFVDAG